MPYRSVYCIASSHARASRVIRSLNEIEFPNACISSVFLDLEPVSAGATKTKPASLTSKIVPMSKSLSSIYDQPGEAPVTRSHAIPGLGQLIAAGPVATALAAEPAGSIAGILLDFGVPESEASRYESRIKEGYVFVSIRSENPDKSDQVREIFAAEGAEGICTLMDVITPKVSRRGRYGSVRVPVC